MLATLGNHGVEGSKNGSLVEAHWVRRGGIRCAEELAKDGLGESANVAHVRPVDEACQHFEAVQQFLLGTLRMRMRIRA